MTNEELEEVLENLKYMISDDCTDCQWDFIDEIELAIKALEEQIPQAPIQDGYFDEPCVCPNCGQALKWE